MKDFFGQVVSSKSKIFLVCCFAFIAGLGLANFCFPSFSKEGSGGGLPAIFSFILLLTAGFLVLVFWAEPKKRVVALWLVFLFLGFFRLASAQPNFSDPTKIYHYLSQEVYLQGIVSILDERIDYQKITVAVKAAGQPQPKSVSGRVLVNAPLYPRYQVGDALSVFCQLKAPEKFNDFDYARYLARYDIYAVCSFAQVSLLHQPMKISPLEKISFFAKRTLAETKSRIILNVNRSVNEPEAGVLSALILGARQNITAEWLDKFSAVGVSHIIAVSGTNITIIAMILMYFFISVGLIRQKAFYFSAGSILLFVALIGDQSSAWRAAIMGILLLYAQKIGRLSRITNAIVFAGALMLWLNPKLLFSDAGFQLSYLSVFGLIYLEPVIKKYLKWMPEKFALREMISVTLAAQIMTMPLIIFTFHQVSLVALLANALILPLIPFLTIWGFAELILGAFSLWLAKLMGFVSWLAIGYILKVIGILAGWPLASLTIEWFNLFLLIIAYIGLGFWIYWVNRYNKIS